MKWLVLSLLVCFACAQQGANTSSRPEEDPPQFQSGPDAPASDRTFYLPALIFDTAGTAVPDDPKIRASLKIFNPAHMESDLQNDVPAFTGLAGIELRGHESQNNPKKQYGFDTWDETEEGFDVSLLGLPEDSDWIINGTYTDKTLLRNALAYQLSREMGRYASRSQWVEVVMHEDGGALNLRTQYLGVFALLEKIKRGSERVDIKKLSDSQNSWPDISGGYILKIDKVDPGDLVFVTQQGTTFVMVYPKADQITAAQAAWIEQYIEDFEQSLADEDPFTAYNDFINIDSFVDFFLVNEVFKNVDAYRLSAYVHKDRLGKLVMGPVWDFDFSAGNANYYNAWDPSGWMLGSVPSADTFPQPFWWSSLWSEEAFRKRTWVRWAALRADILSDSHVEGVIDSHVLQMGPAVSENFFRWPILGVFIWPNYFVGSDYAAEIQYLKDWLQLRLAWMDSQLL